MLEHYVDCKEKEKNSKLFDNTEYKKALPEQFEKNRGKFAVISVYLNVHGTNFEEFKRSFNNMLHSLVMDYILKLSTAEKKRFMAQINYAENEKHLVDNPELFTNSLINIISKHYGKKIIFTVDHYDTSLLMAEKYGYFEQATALFKEFFKPLEVNCKVKFAALFGKQKIAPRFLFDKVDDVCVYSCLDNRTMMHHFAYTEDEVRKMLALFGTEDKVELYLSQLSEWHSYGKEQGVELFNPFSITMTLMDLKDQDSLRYDPEWAGGSSDHVVEALKSYPIDVQHTIKNNFDRLLEKESVVKTIHPDIGHINLGDSEEGFWSFLIITGYLAAEPVENNHFRVSIPNKELADFFSKNVGYWFKHLNQTESQCRP